MTVPAITALYAGLSAMILLALTLRVIRLRRSLGFAWGDGGRAELMRAIRAHGNAAETVPTCLILLGLVEMLGAPGAVVHLLGLALVAGRLAHAYSCGAERRLKARVLGMSLTLGFLLVVGLGLTIHALGRLAG
ncbi:MAG: MAPEG family protein [Rubrimonas sp.]